MTAIRGECGICRAVISTGQGFLKKKGVLYHQLCLLDRLAQAEELLRDILPAIEDEWGDDDEDAVRIREFLKGTK